MLPLMKRLLISVRQWLQLGYIVQWGLRLRTGKKVKKERRRYAPNSRILLALKAE